MVSMDIFHSDAFSAIQLTAAVEKIPYRPALLGSLNLFEPDRIRVEWAVIEKRDGTLALIPTSERGAPPPEQVAIKRDIRSFRTVRLAKADTIRASELQNIRAFGSESDLQTVQQEATRMARLRNDLELTLENHLPVFSFHPPGSVALRGNRHRHYRDAPKTAVVTASSSSGRSLRSSSPARRFMGSPSVTTSRAT